MISADRFLARSTNRDEWLRLRAGGVTATSVRDAATPAGFLATVERMRDPQPIETNAYMEFGNESEEELLKTAHREFGILPSDWLIAGENPLHMATPDGLSLDHKWIAEAKTTGDGWPGAETNPKKIPIGYRRQAQFQMYVTGAERCLFLWNLRVPDEHGWFYLGWMSPKTLWIERDEAMISDLIGVADRLIEAKNARTENGLGAAA